MQILVQIADLGLKPFPFSVQLIGFQLPFISLHPNAHFQFWKQLHYLLYKTE